VQKLLYKKTLSILLSLTLLVTLCSCKEKTAPQEEYTPAPSAYNFSPDAVESLDALRGIIKGSEETSGGYVCAVAYLGSLDTEDYLPSANQDAFSALLEENGYTGAYPFLSEISSGKIYETVDGTELYCIVPSIEINTVKISFQSDTVVPEYAYPEGDPHRQPPVESAAQGYATVYECDNNDPVLLCVNSEENPVESIVELVKPDGSIFTLAPSLSQEDGKMEYNEDTFDFSIYPGLSAGEQIIGTWECSYAEDDLGNPRSISITLSQTDDANSAEYSYTALSGSFQGEVLYHYTGTWKIAEYNLPGYDAGSLVLNLTSDGGAYCEAGAPSHDVNIVLQVAPSKENPDSLTIRSIYGDPLLPGTEYTDLIFNKVNFL